MFSKLNIFHKILIKIKSSDKIINLLFLLDLKRSLINNYYKILQYFLQV